MASGTLGLTVGRETHRVRERGSQGECPRAEKGRDPGLGQQVHSPVDTGTQGQRHKLLCDRGAMESSSWVRAGRWEPVRRAGRPGTVGT